MLTVAEWRLDLISGDAVAQVELTEIAFISNHGHLLDHLLLLRLDDSRRALRQLAEKGRRLGGAGG